MGWGKKDEGEFVLPVIHLTSCHHAHREHSLSHNLHSCTMLHHASRATCVTATREEITAGAGEETGEGGRWHSGVVLGLLSPSSHHLFCTAFPLPWLSPFPRDCLQVGEL